MWCKLLVATFGVLGSAEVFAETYMVDHQAALQALLAKPNGLEPGDVVQILPGNYDAWKITIPKNSSGTASNPVVIRGYSTSESDRQTFFSGQSAFIIDAAHIRFEQMHFENTGAPTILVRGTSSQPAWYNRFSKLFFKGSGQGCTSSENCNQAVFSFAQYGRRSRLDHSVFRETRAGISVMVHYLATDNRIDQNLFVDIRAVTGLTNGLDAIHIGTVEKGDFANHRKYETRAQVDHNIFLRVQGEKEIISSKTYGNEIIANLFLHSDSGLLSLRAGGRTRVIANAFLNTNGAVSVNGEQHEIVGNFAVPHRTSTSRNYYGSAGIDFMVGSHDDQAGVVSDGKVITYLAARENYIHHNTVVGGYIQSPLPSSPVGIQRSTGCGVDKIGKPIPCDEIPFLNNFQFNRFIALRTTPLVAESGVQPAGLADAFRFTNWFRAEENDFEEGVTSFEAAITQQISALANPLLNKCLKLAGMPGNLPHGSRFEPVVCGSSQDAMLTQDQSVGRVPLQFPLVLPKTQK